MSIRWKLLFLLLAIALIPLVVVSMLANRATARLGWTLGDQTRTALTELTRQQLETVVDDKARIIAREAAIVSLAVQVQAREVEKSLAVESPLTRDIYLAEDFDGERPPPDLEISPRHMRSTGPGRHLPVPVSFGEPVFKLAPGLIQHPVNRDMLRLALAVPAYCSLQERHGELLYWHYTSLESGVHSSYPGHGGYPVDYDPRQRRWYVRAKAAAGEVVWSPPYTDATSRRSVLTAAKAVYRPDGSFAGVTAIDIVVSELLERARMPRFGSSVAAVVALDPHQEWDANTPREVNLDEYVPEQLGMLIVAQPAPPESEGQWHSPIERSWLRPDNAEQALQIVRDLYEGRSNVRHVQYGGHPTMWAYSQIWGPRASLVVIAPHAEVVADAARAQQTVLSLTRSHMRLAVATLGVVMVLVIGIALAGSRTITRPVSELVEGAQRVAGGDFDIRVNVRTRDELGELGQAFNQMVPQLEDRIRIRQALNLAMEVQQSLLPKQAPQLPGLQVAGRSIYCDETGGDYYDFLNLSELSPHELGVAVGDVAGHGIAAALLMTTARAILRSRADRQRQLSQMMQDVNRLLCQDTPTGRYMTLLYLAVDARQRCVRWANAGHDPAITYDPQSDSFGQLDGGDLPLGIFPDESYSEYRHDNMSPGEIVVMGTDGIWECRDWDGRQFGKDTLRQIVREHAAGSAEDICQAITQGLDKFRNGCPQEDDVTLVVMKFA